MLSKVAKLGPFKPHANKLPESESESKKTVNL